MNLFLILETFYLLEVFHNALCWLMCVNWIFSYLSAGAMASVAMLFVGAIANYFLREVILNSTFICLNVIHKVQLWFESAADSLI